MEKISEMIDRLCPEGVDIFQLGDVSDIIRGKRVTKGQLLPNGIYPVISGGVTPMGYIKEYNREANTITVSQYGTAGYVDFQKEQFWANDICYCVYPTDNLDNRYLWYVLKGKQEVLYAIRNTDATPFSMPIETLKGVEIPLPPLSIQQEIVRILDSFTSMITNLETELTSRQKQYEYYRKKLLTFDENDESVEWKTLGEISHFRRGSFPQPYGLAQWYDGEGSMPFVQVADVNDDGFGLANYTKRKISKLAQPMSVYIPKGSVIVTLQGTIGRVAITDYECYMDRTLAYFDKIDDAINTRYFAYQLKRKFGIEKEHARGNVIKTITKEEFQNFEIALPSVQRQQEIVSTLDTFESLIQNIKQELEARKKQYEYYREKLLTFE